MQAAAIIRITHRATNRVDVTLHAARSLRWAGETGLYKRNGFARGHQHGSTKDERAKEKGTRDNNKRNRCHAAIMNYSKP